MIAPTIRIAPYNPDWPKAFAQEATRVRTFAPILAVIEHIGNTAVPGLAAKPVIDMWLRSAA